MRRIGGSSGMGWGSGGGGGGGVFRTVSRVSRAGMGNLQDAPSSPSESSSSSPCSNSKRGLTLSNATPLVAPSLVSLSTSVQGFGPAWPRTSPDHSDSDPDPDPDWVRVQPYHHDDDDDDEFPISDALLFRSAPSSHEVTSALLSLQQAVPSSSSSESDWIEPSWKMYSNDQRMYPGIGSVYDALHLLRTDSSVQRMVISLSSDRAVWDAVLNNVAVQELRESLYQGEAFDSDEESDSGVASANMVSWVFSNMRSKFMEFVTAITNRMKEAFQPPEEEQPTDYFPDGFGEKVTAAFMLTAIVLLIFVVSRANHSQV